MTTALARQQPFSLAPTNFAELERFANIVARSSFAPKNFIGKPGDVMIAVQMGVELGLSPMQALQNIAPVNGKPSVYGDAVPAICMQHPDFVSIKEDDLKDITKKGEATCVVVRRGMDPVTVTFSIADAKTAKLWGKQGPWSDYPSRMLQMRARGFACRDAFPDALRGIITREEAEDIPRETVRAEVVMRPATVVERAAMGDPTVTHVPETNDPIHEAMHEEMSKPRTQTDPESYVIRARGKNEGRKLGELGSDSLAWYAENSRDPELKRYAQAVIELRIARETSATQAEIETLTENDAWGLSGEQAEVAT
jgi:hypothetical protein